MVRAAFLHALPSVVNYYNLESHFFIVYEKNMTLQILLKRNLEKIFSTKAKTLHIVQADQDLWLLHPESADLSPKDLAQLKHRLVAILSDQSHVRQIKPENG